MGLRFNKRIKICKGVSVNLGKKGASLSVGTKGARVNIGKKGVRTTVGIPGTGISYTDYKKYNDKKIKENKINNIPKVQEPKKVIHNLPVAFKLCTPPKIVVTEIISLILFVLGFIFAPLMILAIVGIISTLYMMASNKQFKCNFNLQLAKNSFINGNLKKSNDYCNRALECDSDNESAKILIEEIKRINETSSIFDSNMMKDDISELDINNDVILNKQVERNLKGKEFEKQGDMDGAIALYELNVKDGFEGTHPYDRLAIIYRKQKKYDDEIRIINKSIEMFNDLYLNCKIEARKEGFKKIIERFQYRLKRAIELKNK